MFKSFLESAYAQVIAKEFDITELPNSITSELLCKFQKDQQFNDYKIVINSNIYSKDLNGDVKSITSALFNSKTDGIITIQNEYKEKYIIVITLIYIKF